MSAAEITLKPALTMFIIAYIFYLFYLAYTGEESFWRGIFGE